MNRLDFSKFSVQFDSSYHPIMKDIIESEQFYKDWQELKKLGKTKRIIPSSSSNNLFRMFREVKKDDITCAIIGLAPYNTILPDGREVADGLK